MKRIVNLFLCLSLLAVCSCGDDNKTDDLSGGANSSNSNNSNNSNSNVNYTPKEFVVKGQVEKGPFISGSVINMQPLNQKMQAVGSTYSATITDDMGSFAFNSEEFSEPYARLSVNGYFYNEYKGNLSNGQIMLQSVVDLRDKNSVNVNLLTHLKYQRVLNLIADSVPFADANAQAQEELFKSFGLQKMNTSDASQFSVAAGTDEAAALIVTSALLLGERTEAQFTEYLANLCKDFATDGQFSQTNKEQINKDKEKLATKLKDIRQHLIDRYTQLGRSITVKELISYVDWDDNGTAGDEAHDPTKPVTLSQNSIQAPVEGGTYRITYSSDVKLYLSPKMGSLPNMGASTPTLTDYGSISKNIELDDNTLVVTISPTDYQNVYDAYIYLYDFVGNEVAKISVMQAGKPNGKWLTSLGENIFLGIKQYVISDPLSLVSLRYEALSYSDITVYHLDDVFRGYVALGYLLGGYFRNIESLEQVLLQSVGNLSEEPMGYCQTAEDMARMSADVIRYVLARYYMYDYSYANQRAKAKNLLETIINKGVYSNSCPILGVDNTTIIPYQEVVILYQELNTSY